MDGIGLQLHAGPASAKSSCEIREFSRRWQQDIDGIAADLSILLKLFL